MPKSAKRRLRVASQKFNKENKNLSAFYGRQCKIISDLIIKYGAEYSENNKAVSEKESLIAQIMYYL